MTKVPEPVEDRRTQMLSAAIQLAEEKGWYKLTHTSVAAATQTDRSLVNYYLGSKANFRDEVMKVAVQRRLIPVVAEGLLYLNDVALSAPQAVQREARAYMKAHDMKLPRWRVATENGVVHAWA